MPSSANYVRNYKQEFKQYGSKPQQMKNRAARNRAHRLLEKALGKEIKGDVDHKRPLSKGGTNVRSNLRPLAPSQNRSFKRTSKGAYA